jgi:CSLREA domain-containing protein
MSRGNRGIIGRGSIFAAAIIGMLALMAAAAEAQTTIVVNSLNDPNDTAKCTLRDAINVSQGAAISLDVCVTSGSGGPYTIVFRSGMTGTIRLTSALPAIGTRTVVSIDGPTNTPGITIDGNNQYGILSVSVAGTLSIDDLTIADGKKTGAVGGGIANGAGLLTVTNCTFSGNSADGGGAIGNTGTTIVTNSTFSNNRASEIGGAILNVGTLTITDCTFSGNSGKNGGGIENSGANVNLKGTILADSTGGNCLNNGGDLNDKGYNISDDDTCGFTEPPGGTSKNNATGIGLASGPAQNGGPTQTIALMKGGLANTFIPAGECNDQSGEPLTTDQRGFTRPVAGTCSAGAYQYNAMDCNSAFASSPNLTAILPVMFFPEYISGVNNQCRPFTLKITGVTQDKRPTGFPLCPNAFTSGTTTYVRTNNEPLKGPDGLLYRIQFTATDPNSGASCMGAVPVCVQDIFHSGEPCLASFESFDATRCPR